MREYANDPNSQHHDRAAHWLKVVEAKKAVRSQRTRRCTFCRSNNLPDSTGHNAQSCPAKKNAMGDLTLQYLEIADMAADIMASRGIAVGTRYFASSEVFNYNDYGFNDYGLSKSVDVIHKITQLHSDIFVRYNFQHNRFLYTQPLQGKTQFEMVRTHLKTKFLQEYDYAYNKYRLSYEEGFEKDAFRAGFSYMMDRVQSLAITPPIEYEEAYSKNMDELRLLIAKEVKKIRYVK